MTIRIKKIEESGNLMLDLKHGIGADLDIQQLYRSGTFAEKSARGYGPHISMCRKGMPRARHTCLAQNGIGYEPAAKKHDQK